MSEDNQTNTMEDGYLRFWQQNLNKSSDAQLDFLHRIHPRDFDLAAVQEPHINFLGNAQATSKWITVYPSTHQISPQQTRALMMINRSMISSNAWTQLDIPSPDVVAIQMVTANGTLRAYNMYNDCTQDDTSGGPRHREDCRSL
jgi:cephalosporin-C deacetylase-like acetyl esterase